jgi:hypothetical protein
MKTWLVRLVLVGALGSLGFWAWSFLFPTPEHVIRKELAELARAASIAPNEAPLTKLAKTQKLLSFFAGDAQVTVDVPGRSAQTFNGHDDLQQAAMGARSMLNNLKIELVDVVVTVGADKQSAVANLTAAATLPGEKIPEVQELEMGFKKADRDWLITRVETVKTLR